MEFKYMYIYENRIYYSWEEILRNSDYSVELGHYYARSFTYKPKVEEMPIPSLLAILRGLD